MTWKIVDGEFPHRDSDGKDWRMLGEHVQDAVAATAERRTDEIEALAGGDPEKEKLIGSLLIDAAATAIRREAAAALVGFLRR